MCRSRTDESSRHPSAVDLDAGGVTPATQLLEGVGNELLSGPPLAGDEYGGIGPCHALDLPVGLRSAGAGGTVPSRTRATSSGLGARRYDRDIGPLAAMPST